MAGRVHAFAPMLSALKAIGLARPSNTVANRLWTVWNYIVIGAGLEFIFISLHEVFTSNAGFHEKLEYTAFICSNISATFRVTLMTIRKKELFTLLKKMEALLQHMEFVNGTNSLPKLKRKCLWVAIVISVMYTLIPFNSYYMAYVKYYVMGIEDPAPFEIPIPFEKRHNIHAVVWYEVFQFYSSITAYGVTGICFLSISLATAELIRKLAECYERINSSNVDALLKQTTKWHSKVVGLMNKTNSLLGTIMMTDFFLSMQFISIVGYLLIRVGLANAASFSKYIALYFGLLSCPLAFCLGGHIVAFESDTLYGALQNNEWYLLTPKSRKDLILPTMVASKGLSWNYRGFLYFDMSLYLDLLKQSYSFIAFLKIMG